MSTPSSATISRSVEFEVSAGGSVVCVDFQSIAGLLDLVIGSKEPVRLTTLLSILWETSFKLEARTVIRAAVACRDPLAELGETCKTALQTITDLERLAEAQHWRSIDAVVGRRARACALLNACDNGIERVKDGKKRARLRAIRERLHVAAQAERGVRGDEIRVLAGLRQARCPTLWETLETWRDKD